MANKTNLYSGLVRWERRFVKLKKEKKSPPCLSGAWFWLNSLSASRQNDLLFPSPPPFWQSYKKESSQPQTNTLQIAWLQGG